MTQAKQLDPSKVKVEEVAPKEEEKKENLLKRGVKAGERCCNALKSIFASIGQMIMGHRKPSWLARATAGFLTILGWLFFTVAFTPALLSATCAGAAHKLGQVDEDIEQNQVCSEESL